MAEAPAPPAESLLPLFCDGCGKRALHNGLFGQAWDPWRGGSRTYCPRCWRACEGRNERHFWLIVAVIAVVALAGVTIDPGPSAGWVVLNLLLAVVFYWALILPHELGHAVAGWLTGLRVFRICLGSGISVYMDSKWGLFFRDDLPRGYGMVIVGHRHVRFFRLRNFLTTLGGPAANVLLVGAVAWLLTPEGLWRQAHGTVDSIEPVVCLVLGNILMLWVGLVPRGRRAAPGALVNDGRLLVEALFTSPETIRQSHASYFLAEAEECAIGKDFDGARRWIEACLEHYPDNPAAVSGRSSLLLRDRRFLAARQAWLDLAGQVGLEPVLRMQFLDCAATADLLLLLDGVRTFEEGGTAVDVLAEARRLSDAAVGQLDLWPGLAPSFYGTRGSILVEEGRLAEGCELLAEVIEEFEHDVLKAICVCYLALAAARRGDRAESTRLLAEASALDPDSPFLAGTARQCPR
jgi:hypothetical protein